MGSSKRLCTCLTTWYSNGNNKWKDALDLEIEQIKEYQVVKDYGIVGSTQVPFLMCTLEIPQKLQRKFLLLTFSYLLLLSLFSNYELFMYFCFCSFFLLYGSFNHITSTSLSSLSFLYSFYPYHYFLNL